MSSSNPNVYRFDEFRLDTGRRLLFKGADPVALPPIDILQILIERAGEIVEKDELMRLVWADAFVEDNNLTVNMTMVRRALGEKRGENRFVVTVPGRGYRFAAAISTESRNGTEAKTALPAVQEPPKSDSPISVPRAARQRRLSPAAMTLIGLAGVGLVIFAGWLILRRAQPPKIETGQVKTLAVLPFRPLAPSEQDAILGVGMADAVITKLSGMRRITVRPTSAIAKYAVGNNDLIVAGKELGVDAVLDGKLQRSGDALRISVQLIRVSDNSPLWAGVFDTKETDIFALQDSISAQVADSLAFRLNDDERRQIAHHSTDNAEAYKLYLNGVYQLNKRNLPAAKRSVDYFEQAIRKQPDYALAYAGLGDAYVMLGNQEALLGALPPADYVPKAKVALEKALSLDDTLAEAHASMAWVSIWETGDIAVSQQDLRRALELNPDLANAHNYNGILKMTRGQFDEALIEMRKAQAIDQFSLVYNQNIATVLYRQRRYDEAEIQCRKTLELDQNFARAHWLLGLVHEARGNYPEATASLRRAVDLSNGGTLARASLAHALAKSGDRAEAEKILSELIANAARQYVAPDYIAMVYTALGDKERAYEYLEKALADRTFSVFLLNIEQRFDEIRSDPRFAALEARTEMPRATP